MASDKLNNNTDNPKKTTPFVTEIARYFMDFLETDFHKVHHPKRFVQNHNSNNLQIGINLNKYKKYSHLVWKVIKNGFEDSTLKELKRGVYTNRIPQSLIKLIQGQISVINQKDIQSNLKLFKNEIELGISKNPNDTLAAITCTLEGISRIIREEFLITFVDRIREPLTKIKAAHVDSVYQIEEELTNILLKPFGDIVSLIVNKISLGKKMEATQQLAQAFELKDIQNKLESYFKGFAAGDLFFEVFELVNNKALLEKQELYLYFCDLTYKNHTYPLFYIPVEIEKTGDGFSLNFDALIYVNKKAIQYVSQHYSSQIERKGSLGAFVERIIYLSESNKRKHLIGDIDLALKEVVNYFGLYPYIDIYSPEHQIAKGIDLQVSNSCYFTLSDRSDESLINDYEEILQKLKVGDDKLASAFQLLIDDFITNNPESITSEVESEWEGHSSSEKLVYTSPVPLNEEQRQILIALNKQTCKYITVEGPPGTGKSHTITAIVCDAILKSHAVLVLSDKKEALDVVEDKITETMNKVRLDKQFQNPILRLGQAGNSYSKILSTTSMEHIKEHYKAVRSKYQKLEDNISHSTANLKKEIQTSIAAYEKIMLPDIMEFSRLEARIFQVVDLPFELEELHANQGADGNLKNLRSKMLELKRKLINFNIILENLFKNYYSFDQSIRSFRHFLNFLALIQDLKIYAAADLKCLSRIREISTGSLEVLDKYIFECMQLKSQWFGYIFKGKKASSLNLALASSLKHDFDQPHKQLDTLKAVTSILRYAQKLKTALEISSAFEFNADFIQGVHQLLTLNIPLPTESERNVILDAISSIESLLTFYPITSQKFGFNPNNFFSLYENKLTQYSEADFNLLIQYLYLKNKLHEYFLNIPEQHYSEDKKIIEELVTTQMTYKMDERVIDFFEKHKSDAKTLARVISKKQPFDKSSFEKLKNAFPCILAGIRDFAEYIPLESDLFDIIIIDEASQVSIAQAFPALLRGKRIIVLGDKKQFSNIKSAQASSDINKEYLNRLQKVFLDYISNKPMELARLEKFNIKTSILDFFEHISNYSIMLKKHFRGYRENISYSNKYFYNDSLQAIKIRAKSIDDVIRFTQIEHDGRMELIENTNKLEIEAIIAEVENICKEDIKISIGIITPHTNQQKLLVEAFSKHSNYEHFQKQHKLKIMTFDTCQGEERDIILYSMVANQISDKLWGVFVKDRGNIELEESGKIKLQRLNVGFSRAKEQMHFFLSKPVQAFSGSIGEALQHYHKVLEMARKLPDVDSTDARSPMEKKVLNWLQETIFFKSHQTTIELQAQFPLGEAIKQLDKHYSHPLYVSDFLLIYTDEDKIQHKIIIEYDGFEYHFKELASINEFNYGQYYTNKHVYREKVLESYGYKFIRINRFNIGKEPIETLNRRLLNIIKKNTNIVIH